MSLKISLNNIDSLTLEVLEIISDAAFRIGIPFFIVGATARDIYFKSRRATMDLDIGIQIASWKSFNTLIEELLKSGKFRNSCIAHRLFYKTNNFPVDILPFGALSDTHGIIRWSDKNEMSIVGFEEAFKNSLEFSFKDSSKTIQVASPAGLAVMKLISWLDSSDRRKRDAEDLNLIFSDYHTLFNNSERVFEYPNIMECVEFDLQQAGTVLLGIDAASLCSDSSSYETIKSILSSSDSCEKLSIDMRDQSSLSDEFDSKLQMIMDFKTGFLYDQS